jgi:SAM-dependent methyltransferase
MGFAQSVAGSATRPHRASRLGIRMAEFDLQVPLEHYESSYDSLERFVSYWVQKDLILTACEECREPKVLEIGTGTGFLTSYLKTHGVNVVSFDFDERLQPDITGDIREIDAIIEEPYDVVSCFEVLEHIPYDHVADVVRRLRGITRGICVISVPQRRLYVSVWLKIPRTKPVQFYRSLPFSKRHSFDGQHYWELGYRGYPVKRFRHLLSKHFEIDREFTNPLMPYHRFFVLRKAT